LLGFFSIAWWIQGELRNSYSQVVEEILVDFSYLMSAHLENNRMSTDSFKSLQEMFDKNKSRKINAQIFDFKKINSNLSLYVTDAQGKVVHASDPALIGRDFSQWNDVYKTLKGEYGARSTRVDAEDSRTSVYYVAAPIIIDEKIAGVATISKTESSILVFLDRALSKMFLGGLFSVIALGFFGGMMMIWITLPLEKLRKYALEVSKGQRSVLPQTKIRELQQLGEAFEKMRISLEGKKTVEKYTQTLTHELKSPLTAIKGAAELCLEEMDQSQREQFLKNIIEEADRSHHVLNQLLKIAALESKQQLDQTEAIPLAELLHEAKNALLGLWKSKNLNISISCGESERLRGDRFLVFQALRNILQNAIDFSEPNSNIEIQVAHSHNNLTIQIVDQGAGIPAFALDRVFEKFYSLERPDTKRRSSGLGLSFVKEVVELHRGKIRIQSPFKNQRGTEVTLEFQV
jgi:two-component system sensor histidine kinase CreC